MKHGRIDAPQIELRTNAAVPASIVFPNDVAAAAPSGKYLLLVEGGVLKIVDDAAAVAELVSTTRAALDIYVSPGSGDDADDGSLATPIATLAEAERRVPLVVMHPVVIRLRNEPGYVWPVWRPRLISAPIVIMADEAWDPTVYTVVASGTAAGGTTDSVVVDAGMGVDAHRNLWLRMTSGAASGHRKGVRNNTATDIVPWSKFGTAPAPGDSYEIFQNEVEIALTAPVGDDAIVLVSGVGRDVTRGREGSPGCFVFAGVTFTGSSRVGVSAPCVFYGCVSDPRSWDWNAAHPAYLGCDTDTGVVEAVLPNTLFGAPSITAWRGWGMVFSHASGPVVSTQGGTIAGYWSTAPTKVFSTAVGSVGTLRWIGGSCGRLSLTRQSNMCELGVRIDSTKVLIDGTSSSIFAQQGAQLQVGLVKLVPPSGQNALAVESGAEARVHGAGGLFAAEGESPDVATVNATHGGRVYTVDGAPTLGRAVGADWDVGNGFPQNKSFFAAGGDHIAHTDGSLVVRT